MEIRIILADDHGIFREGLRALLEKESDVQVVGEAGDGQSTVELASKLKPDVVIMDVAMPDMNGIEATRQIIAAVPGVKVIALSMHSDRRFVRQMLYAGASAYLQKGCKVRELILAVRTVVSGQNYFSPEIASTVTQDYVRYVAEAETSPFASLTSKEHEVLQLVAEGRPTKTIAADLGVSIKTVLTHRRNIMKKLGVESVAELVKYAIREGLTSVDE